MKRKPFLHLLFLLLGCWGLMSQPSHALLLETQVYWPGDKLLTVDTRTGLQWLDLTVTDGFSINEALASPWVTALGFRVANAHEVDSLLESAGLAPDVFNPRQTAPEEISYTNLGGLGNVNREVLVAYRMLEGLLGVTAVSPSFPPFGGYPSVAGLFLGTSGPGGVGLNVNEFSGGRGVIFTTLSYDTLWDGFGFDGSDEDYGVYLVRVPEPAPLFLMLAGLVAIRLLTARLSTIAA